MLESRILAAATAAGLLGQEPEWGAEDDAVWEGGGGDDEDEEEVVGLTEEELLGYLDAAESPLTTCQRLFGPLQPGAAPRQLLSAAAERQLRRRGWAVLPLLSCELAAAAGEQARSVELVSAASLGHAGFTDAAVRGDAVTFLHRGAAPAAPDTPLGQVLEVLAALRAELATLARLELAAEPEFQLSVYPANGAAYGQHRDTFPDDGTTPRQRRLTAVLYLNRGEWDTAAHGGALRLHVPSLASASASVVLSGEVDGDGEPMACVDERSSAAYVDVAPSGGVCVIFLSGAVEHEVLPCSATRAAVTAWCR